MLCQLTFVTQLSAKDVSLFEERIRRSGIKPPSAQSQSEPAKPVTPVERTSSPVPTEASVKAPGTVTKQPTKGSKATKWVVDIYTRTFHEYIFGKY